MPHRNTNLVFELWQVLVIVLNKFRNRLPFNLLCGVRHGICTHPAASRRVKTEVEKKVTPTAFWARNVRGKTNPHLNRPHATVKAHFSLALRIFARKLAHELASRALFSGFSAFQAGIGCARVRRSVVVRNSSTTFTMTRIRGYSFSTIFNITV
jgi:hypothetical protein